MCNVLVLVHGLKNDEHLCVARLFRLCGLKNELHSCVALVSVHGLKNKVY